MKKILLAVFLLTVLVVGIYGVARNEIESAQRQALADAGNISDRTLARLKERQSDLESFFENPLAWRTVCRGTPRIGGQAISTKVVEALDELGFEEIPFGIEINYLCDDWRPFVSNK